MSASAFASSLAVVLGIGALLLMLASYVTIPRGLRGRALGGRLLEAGGLGALGVLLICVGAAFAAAS